MRQTIRSAVFLIACAVSTPALADTIAAASRITAVTVYADRATITREAEIDIPAGASTISIDNLPAGLLADSLRAQGSAVAVVTLGALDSKRVNQAELAMPRARELQAKLQEIQDKRALLQAEATANDTRQTFLGNIGKQAAAAVDQNFTHLDLKPEQWSAAASMLFESMAAARKAGVANAAAMREIDAQVNKINADLAQLQSGGKATVSIAVPVEAKAATRFSLKLSYQLPGATWRPIYDARLDTASGKLLITQFGEVRQLTGEDWGDVALTLSTARPAQGATPPALSTAWVDLFEAQERYTNGSYGTLSAASGGQSTPAYKKAVEDQNRQNLEMAVAPGSSYLPSPMPATAGRDAPVDPMMEFKTVTTPQPVAAGFVLADINTHGYVAEFKIPGHATIESTNAARKVMIGDVEMNGDLVEQVRPALNANAFLMVRTKIAGDASLLPGDASLFRDGVYIGRTQLPSLRAGEEATLPFGIDDQIVVKRQIVEDTKGKSGFVDKTSSLTRKFDTTIQNLRKMPVKVEVQEALPVAKNDRITVDILSDSTTPDYQKDVDNITGLAMWPLDIPAGGKADVKLGWQVTWPAGSRITDF